LPSEPVSLIPFYQEYRRRHVTYWDVLTEEQWAARETEYRVMIERQRAIAARTVDEVMTGDEASERAHGLQGEKSEAATEFAPTQDLRWRHAVDGGWFSYEMKLPGGQAAELQCIYWGGDAGNRTFDILVDGVVVATETLRNEHPGEFFERVYPIAASIAQNKASVVVRFQPHPGNVAGGVFGCRVLRQE
jgi:uncharacterized protein